jgi:formylglycine-generating enzyme required for sulfatase activity
MGRGTAFGALALVAACFFPDPSGLSFDAGSGTCQGEAGAAGVFIGSYCVDATEVTNAEYAAFLATAPDPTQQIARCAWNKSFAPSTPPAAGLDTSPVVHVDWCDAYAYCAWAGKHLCGQIGGGPNGSSELVDPSKDEWYRACSRSGVFTYPYGTGFDVARCNVPENEAGAVRPASSQCTGSYGGLFDMVGNADEWEDACDDAGGSSPQNDNCTRRSGSWSDPVGILETCAFSRLGPRNQSDDDIGFRCCAGAVP